MVYKIKSRARLIGLEIVGIEALEFTLGVGRPDIGDLLFGNRSEDGSGMFAGISEKLKSAIPGSKWLGQASEAYGKQNKLQEVRARAVADIDKAAGGAISAQAAAVQTARDKLREEREWLGSWPETVAIVLSYIPLVGGLLSKGWQTIICGIAARKVASAMAELLRKTLENAKTLITNMLNLQNILTLLGKIPSWFEGLFPGLPNIGDLIPKIPGLDKLFPNLPKLPKWDDLFNGIVPKLPNFGNLFPKLKDIPIIGGIFKGLPGLPMIPSLGKLFPNLGLPNIPGLLGFPGLSLPNIPGIGGLPSITNFIGKISGLVGLGGLPSLPSMGNLASTMSQLTSLSGGMGGLQQMGQMGQQGMQGIQQMAQQGQQGAQGGEGEKAPVLASAKEEVGKLGEGVSKGLV